MTEHTIPQQMLFVEVDELRHMGRSISKNHHLIHHRYCACSIIAMAMAITTISFISSISITTFCLSYQKLPSSSGRRILASSSSGWCRLPLPLGGDKPA